VIEQVRAGATEAVSVAWLPGDAGDVTDKRRTWADAVVAVVRTPTTASASKRNRSRMKRPSRNSTDLD